MRKNTRFDKKFNAKCDHCGRGFFRYTAECHDLLHSIKGGELRETLNAKLAHGNPQANQSNINTNVDWKLQRLMGEDIITNKPDTSTAPERDEIVRACLKEQDVELKSSTITN